MTLEVQRDIGESIPKMGLKVTIGMPVYNGEPFLRRALDSLLSQTFTSFELIVSDNASTDHTEQISREYAARDRRIRYFRQSDNKGAAWNFSFVLEKARAEYFMWAACDDYWHPDFVAAAVQELSDHPEASVAMCAVERIHENQTTLDVVKYSGNSDPNRMSNFRLAMALAAGRPYHLYIYGLYRLSFLRRAFQGFPKAPAGDRMFVCQAALATRFRYVDRILHFRQVNSVPISTRYKNEALGHMWKQPFPQERTILSVGPYLLRSTVIPIHRKLLVPIIVLGFVGRYVHDRLRSVISHLPAS